VVERFGDPKKIAQAIASFVYGSLMHNKIVGLEGKKRFGSCKKKLDTMIGSLIDSHHLDKINFLVP
jgi:predicted alternative tryptophan synthase beta-subunit